MKQNIIKKIVIVFLILLTVGYGLSYALNSNVVINLITNAINKQLKEVSYVKLNFQILKLQLIPLSLNMYGIDLFADFNEKDSKNNKDGKNKDSDGSFDENNLKKLTKLSRLTIKPSLKSFLLGKIKVAVEVSDMDLTWPLPVEIDDIIKNNNTSDSLDKKEDKNTSIDDIPIDYVSIQNSNISATIEDDGDIFQIYAYGINTSIKIPSLEKIKANLDILKFSLKYNDMRILEESNLNSLFTYQNGAFKLDRFSLKEEKLLVRGTLFGSVKEGVYSLLQNNSGNIFQKSIRQIISGKIQKIGLNLEENLNKYMSLGKEKKTSSDPKYLDIEGSLEVESDFSTVGRILNIDNSKGYFKSDNLQLKINVPFSPDKTMLSLEAPIEFKDSYLSGFHLMDGSGILRSDQDFLYLADIKVFRNNKPIGVVDGSIGYDDIGLLNFKANLFNLKFVDLMKILDVSFTDVLDFDLSTDNFTLEGTMEPLRLSIKAPVKTKSLEIFPVKPEKDSLKYNKPDCDMGLNLLVTDEYVSFIDNDLKCNVESKNKEKVKKEKRLSNLQKSKDNDTSIIFSGKIDYEKGVDLSLESLDFNLKLLEYYLQSPVEGKSDLLVNISGNDNVQTSVYLKGTGVIQNININEIDIKTFVTSDSVIIEDSFLGVKSSSTVENNPYYIGQTVLDKKQGINIDKIKIDLNNPEKSEFKLFSNNIDKNFVKKLISNLSSSDESFGFDVNSLKINLVSDPNNLFEGEGDISFSIKNGSLDKDIIFDNLSSNIRIQDKKIDIKELVYENLSLGFKLNGNLSKHNKNISKKYKNNFSKDLDNVLKNIGFDIRDNISLNFETYKREITNKSLLQARSIPVVSSFFKNSNIDFDFSLKGRLLGSFQELDLSYNLVTDNMKIFNNESQSLSITGEFKDSKFTNSIKTVDNSLIGSYELSFKDKDTKYSLSIDLDQYDVRYLLTSVFAKDFRNYSYISGSFQESGIFPHIPQQGRLKINDVNIKFNFYSKSGEYRPLFVDMVGHPIELVLKDGSWNIIGSDKLVLKGEGSELYLKFSRYSGSEMNLQLYSNINMEVLKNLVDLNLDLTKGSIIANGDLSYSASGLKYNIEIFTKDKINIGGLQPPIKDMYFTINVNNNYLRLNNLFFKKGAGEVSGDGYIKLSQSEKEEESIDKKEGIHLKLKNVEMMHYLPVIKNLETSVSGKLNITGRGFPFKVKGNLRLDKTNSITSADIRNDLVNAIRESSYSVSSEVQENPVVDLDINIKSGEPIHISNRNMNLDLSLDIDLKGTDISPSVLGLVSIDKGKLIYRRDFNVTNGIITFNDSVRIDPDLDIQAVSNIDGYQVSLKVGGRGSDPVVDFTIDPATYYDGSLISKMDIITLVTRGTLDRNKSTGLVDSEVSTEQAMSSEAVSVLAGQLEKPLEYLFRRSGQDFVRQVYIDTYISNTGVSTPRFNFPINVSDDLGLLLKISNYDWKVAVDYSIEDSILVTGSYDQQRQTESEGSTVNVYNPIDTSVDVKFYFSFP